VVEFGDYDRGQEAVLRFDDANPILARYRLA
jgi:hypothetical protein